MSSHSRLLSYGVTASGSQVISSASLQQRIMMWQKYKVDGSLQNLNILCSVQERSDSFTREKVDDGTWNSDSWRDSRAIWKTWHCVNPLNYPVFLIGISTNSIVISHKCQQFKYCNARSRLKDHDAVPHSTQPRLVGVSLRAWDMPVPYGSCHLIRHILCLSLRIKDVCRISRQWGICAGTPLFIGSLWESYFSMVQTSYHIFIRMIS